jgi:hypothetical protein
MGEAARRLNYQLVEPRDGSASSDGGSAQAALVIVHGLFGSGDNWMSLGRDSCPAPPGGPGRPSEPRSLAMDRQRQVC